MMEPFKRIKISFEEAIRNAKLQDCPVFEGPEGKWQACEEMVLLTSMQHFGYGNWAKHADVLTKNFDKEFTEQEVHNHYINTYRVGDIAEAMKPIESDMFRGSIKDHVSKENYELLKSADVNAHKNVPPEFLQKIGYMPLRNDFIQEHEPTAEDLIYHSKLTKVDEYEKNLNFIVLDAYRQKINERFKLKKLIKRFRLVEQYYAIHKQSEESMDNKSPDIKSLFNTNSETFPPPSLNGKINKVYDLRKRLNGSSIKYENDVAKQSFYEKEKAIRLNEGNYTLLDEERNAIYPNKFRRRYKKRNKVIDTLLSEQEMELASDRGSRSFRKKLKARMTKVERELCMSLKLRPVYYTKFKAYVLCIERKRLKGELINESIIPSDMTVSQCLKIVIFMKNTGWIQSEKLLDMCLA